MHSSVPCTSVPSVAQSKMPRLTSSSLAGHPDHLKSEHSHLLRRCPKALHERCMSRKIHEDPTRIWRAMLNKDGTLSQHTQVSENFFYCGRHQTQNMMQGPMHEGKLFSKQLWKRWRTAYALKFRCLASSAEYIPTWTRIRSEDLSVALSALNEGVMPTSGIQTEPWRIVNRKRIRMERHESEGDRITDANHLLQRDARKSKAPVRSIAVRSLRVLSLLSAGVTSILRFRN